MAPQTKRTGQGTDDDVSKKSTVEGRVSLLRRVMLFSYLLAAIICGVVTYFSVKKVEHASAMDLFKSAADQSLAIVHTRLDNLESAGQALADVYGHGFAPDAWPNVALAGFKDIAGGLAASSLMESLLFMPLVRPREVPAFEEFIFPVWNAEPTYSIDAPVYTPQGRGVFRYCNTSAPAPQSCSQRVVVDSMPQTHESPSEFYAPVTQFVKSLAVPEKLLGYDLNSYAMNRLITNDIDDCVSKQDTADAARGACLGYEVLISPNFSTISPANNLHVRMFFPIMLELETPRVVGFVSGIVLMEKLLVGIVPQFVHGLTFVLESRGKAYTFELEHGKALQMREGDYHERHHSSKGKTDLATLGTLGLTAQLSVYPSDEYFRHAEHSNNALWNAFAVAGMVCVCSLIFLLYDSFVRHATTRHKGALETKRRFVRFISHEVRTPLNSVCLGMDIFAAELTAFTHRLAQLPPAMLLKEVQAAVLNWRDLAADVQGNTSAAVDVLNDLLQFDKIESGTLTLQYSGVDLTKVVATVMASFNLQAKEKGVTLKLQLQGWPEELGVCDACMRGNNAYVVLPPDAGEGVAVLEGAGVEGLAKVGVGMESRAGVAVVEGEDFVWEAEVAEVDFKCVARDRDSSTPSPTPTTTPTTPTTPTPISAATKDRVQSVGREGRGRGQSLADILTDSARYWLRGPVADEVAQEVVDVAQEEGREGQDGQLLRVVGDPTRLSQVVRNLISNSLKFTPKEGDIVVTLTWLPVHKGEALPEGGLAAAPLELRQHVRKGSAVVTVTDSGVGLSAQQVARIGGEGVQFNANELQSGQGSGLGMFISKGIVEQHGGSLTVSSPGIDMGASVAVELPICGGFRSLPSPKCSLGEHRSTGPVKPEKVSISAPPQTQPPQALMSTLIPEMLAPHAEPKKGKLLIADDSSTNRKFLTRLLGAHGFDCEGAEDGQQALDMYEAARLAGRPFDAILLDNQMPVMDGPICAQRLRSMGCRCLVVGVTGNVLQEDVDDFLAHGVDRVFGKPLHTDAFECLLATHRDEETLIDAVPSV